MDPLLLSLLETSLEEVTQAQADPEDAQAVLRSVVKLHQETVKEAAAAAAEVGGAHSRAGQERLVRTREGSRAISLSTQTSDPIAQASNDSPISRSIYIGSTYSPSTVRNASSP